MTLDSHFLSYYYLYFYEELHVFTVIICANFYLTIHLVQTDGFGRRLLFSILVVLIYRKLLGKSIFFLALGQSLAVKSSHDNYVFQHCTLWYPAAEYKRLTPSASSTAVDFYLAKRNLHLDQWRGRRCPNSFFPTTSVSFVLTSLHIIEWPVGRPAYRAGRVCLKCFLLYNANFDAPCAVISSHFTTLPPSASPTTVAQ